MVVEGPLIIAEGGASEKSSDESVLRQLVVVLLEKTNNLELIQATYERDLDVMRQKYHDQQERIRQMSEQIDELFARLGLSRRGIKPNVSTSCDEVAESTVPDEPMSPGLSSSLQDVFNQLEFLNDKSIKLESISSCSDDKQTCSTHSLQVLEQDLEKDDEIEDRPCVKSTPILVTTLSYDTSTYNDSTNQSDCNDREEEEGLLAEREEAPLFESKPSELTEENIPPTMRSMKKRGIITQTEVTKIPVVLQSTTTEDEEEGGEESCETKAGEEICLIDNQLDSVKCETKSEIKEKTEPEVTEVAQINGEQTQASLDELTDTFDENSLAQSKNVSKPTGESSEVKQKFPWTRSDTFDVIPLSQSSQISVPVKPKRGVMSPLQSQRHPTERDDTMGDVIQQDKASLDRHHAETAEHNSDTSTFSQVSSNRSSSFDYDVQYIVPQLSEEKGDKTDLGDSNGKKELVEEGPAQVEQENSCEEDSDNPNEVMVTVKVSKPSNSEGEEDVLTN